MTQAEDGAPATGGDEEPELGVDPLPGTSITVRGVLRNAGVPDSEIDRAEAEGTLELFTVERLLLPEPLQYDVTAVAAAAGMAVEQVVQFWRALGFPDPRPGEILFSDADVEMLATVAGLLELGITEPEVAVQMARVIGSSLARVASAQIDAFEQGAAEGRASDEGFALQAGALLPTMPKVMDYVWRHHLKAAAERRMARLANPEAGGDDVLAVGFADLVGFTAVSQQVSAQQLAVMVDRFETVAYETVAGLGGRVVKMIGDEVMFTVDDPAQAVEVALTLAAAYHSDEELSDVRVGVAWGPVLEREADVYGPVVNLASRIVGIAFPGTVVVSDEVHAALESSGGYRWRSLRHRYLKDIGRVPLWSVRRANDPFPEPSRREKAYARRIERREVVVERLAARDHRPGEQTAWTRSYAPSPPSKESP